MCQLNTAANNFILLDAMAASQKPKQRVKSLLESIAARTAHKLSTDEQALFIAIQQLSLHDQLLLENMVEASVFLDKEDIVQMTLERDPMLDVVGSTINPNLLRIADDQPLPQKSYSFTKANDIANALHELRRRENIEPPSSSSWKPLANRDQIFFTRNAFQDVPLEYRIAGSSQPPAPGN
ncbi:Fc.00g071080.m01.CDS01 [Cosmosporella sp. VM-42]